MSSLPNSQNITRVTLPNGIVVLVYEKFDAQSVVISGSLGAGSIFETPAQNGLSSLTASALTRGGLKRDFNAINEALEDIGGRGPRAVSTPPAFPVSRSRKTARDRDTCWRTSPATPPSRQRRSNGCAAKSHRCTRTQDTLPRQPCLLRNALLGKSSAHYSSRGSVESVASSRSTA